MKFFWRPSSSPLSPGQVHPCTIKGKPTLVHHHSLKTTQPKQYRLLRKWADSTGFQLLADRRSHLQDAASYKRQSATQRSERRNPRWFGFWLSALCMVSLNTQKALSESQTSKPLTEEKSRIARFSSVAYSTEVKDKEVRVENLDTQEHTARKNKIEHILLKRLKKNTQKKNELEAELKSIAHYYAQFPAIFNLVKRLDQTSWELTYNPGRFLTNVYGSETEVHYAQINFDPMIGAQLQFDAECQKEQMRCSVSPADLLLHELLHVEKILLHSHEFLKDLSSAQNNYPHRHENSTIALEQSYYREMTQIDSQPRPIRTSHKGKSIQVHCSTCIPNHQSQSNI